MAKKSSVMKATKKMILNLELVIVVLAGAVVLMGFGMIMLYAQKEQLVGEMIQVSQLRSQEEQQLSKYKMMNQPMMDTKPMMDQGQEMRTY